MGEDILNYVFNKGLIPKIYWELIQLNNNNKKKKTNFLKEELNRNFFQRRQTNGQHVCENGQ